MNDLAENLGRLSPEKRALFEHMLAEEETRAKQAKSLPLRGVASTVLPELVPRPDERYAPFSLTDIQQAQWIGGRSGVFELGKTAAHVYVEFDTQNVDHGRWTQAWQRLIAEHDQLRMVILPNELKQKVLRDVPAYEIALLDTRLLPTEQAELELASIRERMAHQVLPGDRWPIFEVCASRLRDDLLRLHVSFDLLVADAWSFRVLMDRWLSLYERPEQPTTPLDITYRDYVLALEGMKTSTLHDESLRYWRERLLVLPPPPELPLAKKPSEIDKQRSEHFQLRIAPAEWRALKARAQKSAVTPSVVFLSAFVEALTVWSKTPRFSVNVTVFNRLAFHPQVNDILVGEFNSFVLLGIDHSQPASFEKRARALQAQLWEALEHRFVSGVRIMRELAQMTGRNSGALMPLVFTSTLAHYDDEHAKELRWPGEISHEISQTPQIWLEHHIWEEHGSLVLRCDAVEGLFPAGMFREVFQAYGRLIDRLCQTQEAWTELDRRFLFPAQELEARQLANSTEAACPAETLDGLFAAQVRRHPDRIAVISADRTLTYRELDEGACQVAHWLRERKVQPNTLVAVAMVPGWAQIVAVLGVLKSGAAYLPVDATVPGERLREILTSGQVRWALTTSALERQLAWPEGVGTASVDGELMASMPTADLQRVHAPTDLSYVIFTSGSTGQPKGVMIEHRSAVNTILDINRRFAVAAKDRVLCLSSLGFDLSVYDVFGLLAAGGALVLPRPDKQREPSHWLDLLVSHQVTLWNTVPALMEMLVDHLEGTAKRLPGDMRLLLLSGDWIPVNLPGRVRALAPEPELEITSLGGATEASIWSIVFPIGEVSPSWKSIPYGKPLANQRFHIYNEALQPTPNWTVGELYIAGAGLARGYWGDEEKTRASFFNHPESGERLYKTGDLGRYLPDGSIEFLGREDQQVKVRGYRIELGEVESVLMTHPLVQQAAVLALGDSAQNRRLVGYVVATAADQLSAEELGQFLARKLPDYMVPSSFELLEAMPRTATGKLDRKALPNQASLAEKKPFVAARNEMETELCKIWQTMLDLPAIGVHDNFFELGGNSLLATQLIFRLRDAFQVELPMARLFESTTIDALALTLEELLLEQLENMSDEAVTAALAAE